MVVSSDYPVLERPHGYALGQRVFPLDEPPDSDSEREGHRARIEPWLSAILQSEHVSLLLGSGFSTAATALVSGKPVDMSLRQFSGRYQEQVDNRARDSARAMGRGEPNIEDQFRAALELIAGLRITQDPARAAWEEELAKAFRSFAESVLAMERRLGAAFQAAERLAQVLPEDESSVERLDLAKAGLWARSVLTSFLLTFASRSPSRERLHVFTTNYDRLVETVADVAGLWQLDRFVGGLTPRFRSSRLDVDLHYNPPGIRGEPRYLEGVIRLTKLHGSIDWSSADGVLRRNAIPFGCDPSYFDLVGEPTDSLIIYPNPAKDVETAEYPYAELFRDFSAATSRPNSALVVFGYGFGDDHINRMVADMLSVPSTHVAIIAFGSPGGRIERFIQRVGRPAQLTVLWGPHFGQLQELSDWYLPKPSLDNVMFRQADLLKRRRIIAPPEESGPEGASEEEADAHPD
jgi:hypothetical protein